MKNLCLLALLLIFGRPAFGGDHFISDETYRTKVKSDFEKKEKELPNGNLFSIFKRNLATYDKEALMFLYAYLPVGDITDYSGEYYLKNIRLSEKARQEMPWGKKIPEDIFRYFVVPVRVNNENLDDSREVFFSELKNRLKGMSMADAALEVNHWCHEKVVYTPSDARTSSPLSSVKSAYGRCGEESTFTVAALRSVGIPARQVYTPRWAHTDDNHAWVEAWIDGKWCFFGACEPEPVLNLGWFNVPASRGMMMNTNVMARYEGKEDVMLMTPNYTQINLTANYAPVAKASVHVTDAGGKPVENAKVEFKIYNYAEFHTVVVRYTDSVGNTSLSAGKGDMLVWASKDGVFGYAEVSFGKTNEVNVVLNKKVGEVYSLSFDIVPPPAHSNVPEVRPEQREKNNRRLAREDSIRNAYVSTFMNKGRAERFIAENGIPAAAEKFLTASRGNWKTLTQFLLEAKEKKILNKALDLLSVVSDKDLRDISIEVLRDHLYYSQKLATDSTDYNKYVLNPRVSVEMITPYKEYFFKAVPEKEKEAYRKDPEKLVEFCKNAIRIDNDLNCINIVISPVGVWKARVADARSRNVFFTALARSMGIPAWIDGVTGKIQYERFDKNSGKSQVYDVDFNGTKPLIPARGRLVLRYEPDSILPNPNYYTHFSISKFKNGTFDLLSYDEGDVDMGGGTSWAKKFKTGTDLDAGYYMLVSGNRQSDGSVLAETSFFNIEKDKTADIALIIRRNESKLKILGQFDSHTNFLSLESGKKENLDEQCRKGYYIIGILGAGQEPTNHALRDIAGLGQEFEKQGLPMIFLFPDRIQSKKFDRNEFPGLPSDIQYGLDMDGKIQSQLANTLKLDAATLPIFVVVRASGEIVFVSQGYTIGLGEQMMKQVKTLDKE